MNIQNRNENIFISAHSWPALFAGRVLTVCIKSFLSPALIKKYIAVLTLLCFIFSSVGAQALQAAIDLKAGGRQTGRQIFEDFVIPQSYGRITDTWFPGLGASRKVVINIQDLHCNPEVQKNISKILSSLDEKYKLGNIYVEGGYGRINTSWLCNISDEKLKNEVLENLLNQGKLTGSEYYSALSNRPGLLEGIEDESVHKANIVRLGRIIERKEIYEGKLKELDKDLEFMKARYMGSRNAAFNELLEKHRKGEIRTDKYYKLLARFMRRINSDLDKYDDVLSVSMDKYPNLGVFLELNGISKHINYGALSRQLQQYMQFLKSELPYSDYNSLLSKTDNFRKVDELYIYLAAITKAHNFELGRSYPELKKLLEYTEKSRNINPLSLIKEDRSLVEEIRAGLSKDTGELEVSFIADFYTYFQDFLFNRLSADDYEYFEQKFDKFRSAWAKYAYKNRLAELNDDVKLLEDFYRTNCQRNQYFINNIPELGKLAQADGTPTVSNPDSEPSSLNATISELLKNSEIVVIVTGGFHTTGLKNLLRQKNISYLSITPNVTQDIKLSNEIYTKLAKEQAAVLEKYLRAAQPGDAQIPNNSLALGLASQANSGKLFELEINAANRILRESRVTDRNNLINEIIKTTGVTADYDDNSGILTFDNGTKIKLDEKDGQIEVTGINYGKFVSQAVKTSIEALINTMEISAAAARGDAYPLFERALKLAAEHYLILGNGLIYEIENDPQLEPLEKIDGIEKEILSRFPDLAQRIIAEREKLNINLNDVAGRSEWLKALLAIDLLRDIIILQNTLPAPGVEKRLLTLDMIFNGLDGKTITSTKTGETYTLTLRAADFDPDVIEVRFKRESDSAVSNPVITLGVKDGRFSCHASVDFVDFNQEDESADSITDLTGQGLVSQVYDLLATCLPDGTVTAALSIDNTPSRQFIAESCYVNGGRVIYIPGVMQNNIITHKEPDAARDLTVVATLAEEKQDPSKYIAVSSILAQTQLAGLLRRAGFTEFYVTSTDQRSEELERFKTIVNSRTLPDKEKLMQVTANISLNAVKNPTVKDTGNVSAGSWFGGKWLKNAHIWETVISLGLPAAYMILRIVLGHYVPFDDIPGAGSVGPVALFSFGNALNVILVFHLGHFMSSFGRKMFLKDEYWLLMEKNLFAGTAMFAAIGAASVWGFYSLPTVSFAGFAIALISSLVIRHKEINLSAQSNAHKWTMESLAALTAKKKILAPEFIAYFRSFLQAVNPNEKPDLTVGYAFSGPDILTAYFATDFKTAYFIDQRRVSKKTLDTQLENWEKIDKVLDYEDYYSMGYFYHDAVQENDELYIIQQLKLLGVERRNIHIFEDNDRTIITFRFNDTDVERTIIFINQDMADLGDEINSELAGKLDVYMQKATMNTGDQNFNYLKSVQSWVKADGFMLLNDRSMTSDTVYDFTAVIGSQYTRVNANNESLLNALHKLGRGNKNGYGSAMVVYKRAHSVTFAASPENARKAEPKERMLQKVRNIKAFGVIGLIVMLAVSACEKEPIEVSRGGAAPAQEQSGIVRYAGQAPAGMEYRFVKGFLEDALAKQDGTAVAHWQNLINNQIAPRLLEEDNMTLEEYDAWLETRNFKTENTEKQQTTNEQSADSSMENGENKEIDTLQKAEIPASPQPDTTKIVEPQSSVSDTIPQIKPQAIEKTVKQRTGLGKLFEAIKKYFTGLFGRKEQTIQGANNAGVSGSLSGKAFMSPGLVLAAFGAVFHMPGIAFAGVILTLAVGIVVLAVKIMKSWNKALSIKTTYNTDAIVYLTDNEVGRYLDVSKEELENYKKHGQRFAIRFLDKKKDAHLLEEWRDAFEADTKWKDSWGNYIGFLAEQGIHNLFGFESLPYFDLSDSLNIGLVSYQAGVEHLEGWIGFDKPVTSRDGSTSLYVSRMENFYRNISLHYNLPDLPGVSTVLFDFTIKWYYENFRSIGEKGKIYTDPGTPGSKKFAEKRNLVKKGRYYGIYEPEIKIRYQDNNLANTFTEGRSNEILDEKYIPVIEELQKEGKVVSGVEELVMPKFGRSAFQKFVEYIKFFFRIKENTEMAVFVDKFDAAVKENMLIVLLFNYDNAGGNNLDLKYKDIDEFFYNFALRVQPTLSKLLKIDYNDAKPTIGRNTWFFMREMLKNAFVHGNNLDMSAPIFFHVDTAKRSMAVYNSIEAQQADGYTLWAAEHARLSGRYLGRALMSGDLFNNDRIPRELAIQQFGIFKHNEYYNTIFKDNGIDRDIRGIPLSDGTKLYMAEVSYLDKARAANSKNATDYNNNEKDGSHAGFWAKLPEKGWAWADEDDMAVWQSNLRKKLEKGSTPFGYLKQNIIIDGILVPVVVSKELARRHVSFQEFMYSAMAIRGPTQESSFKKTLKSYANPLPGKEFILDVVEKSPSLYGNSLSDGYMYINSAAPSNLDILGISHELMHEAGLASNSAKDEAALEAQDKTILSTHPELETNLEDFQKNITIGSKDKFKQKSPFNEETLEYIDDLSRQSFQSQPFSKFAEWLDRVIDLPVETSISDKALADKLNIHPMLIRGLAGDSEQRAKLAYSFVKALPKDNKTNIFIFRDSIPLYTAARLMGRRSKAIYFPKAYFMATTGARASASLVIPGMIAAIKKEMNLNDGSRLNAVELKEFKKRFLRLLKEELQPGKNENLRAAVIILARYMQILTRDSNSIKNGVRFIDTTVTETFVLLLEALVKLPLKELGLAEKDLEFSADSAMFYSSLSSELSYTDNPEDGRQVAMSNYPVIFSEREGQVSEGTGEPLLIEDKTNKDSFLFQQLLLVRDLRQREAKDIPKGTILSRLLGWDIPSLMENVLSRVAEKAHVREMLTDEDLGQLRDEFSQQVEAFLPSSRKKVEMQDIGDKAGNFYQKLEYDIENWLKLNDKNEIIKNVQIIPCKDTNGIIMINAIKGEEGGLYGPCGSRVTGNVLQLYVPENYRLFGKFINDLKTGGLNINVLIESQFGVYWAHEGNNSLFNAYMAKVLGKVPLEAPISEIETELNGDSKLMEDVSKAIKSLSHKDFSSIYNDFVLTRPPHELTPNGSYYKDQQKLIELSEKYTLEAATSNPLDDEQINAIKNDMLYLYRMSQAIIYDENNYVFAEAFLQYALRKYREAMMFRIARQDISELKAIEKKVSQMLEDMESERFKQKSEAVLQPVNFANGDAIYSRRNITWSDVHNIEQQTWHGGSNVIVTDHLGRVLLRKRILTGELDITSGHLHKDDGGMDDDKYKAAAIRLLKSKTGLLKIREEALRHIDIPFGYRRVGKEPEGGEKQKPSYDQKDKTLFHCSSREQADNEYDKFYTYQLTRQEYEEINSASNEVKDVYRLQFVKLEELGKDINTGNNWEKYASSALQLFMRAENVEALERGIYEAIVSHLKKIENASEEVYETGVDKAYLEELIGFAHKTIDAIYARDEQSKFKEYKNVDDLFKRCVVVVSWRSLQKLYASGSGLLEKSKIIQFLDILENLGNDAGTVYGRIVINSMLRSGAQLVKNGNKFFFVKDGITFDGIEIDLNGDMTVSRRVKDGIDRIRKGAVAVDMDKTTAMVEKNIDEEILMHANQLLLMGMRYAVVSGNEFQKQLNRSSLQFVPNRLLEYFTIYANGAGLKVAFDKYGNWREDQSYTKEISGEVAEKANKFMYAERDILRAIWGSLRTEDGKSMLFGSKEITAAAAKKIALEAKRRFGGENHEIWDSLGLERRMEKVLVELRDILRDENEKKERLRNIINQSLTATDEDIQRYEADLKLLKEKQFWPLIDVRKDTNGKKIIQITLKPIITSEMKNIIKDYCDRSAEGLPVVFVAGGETSLDCISVHSNKASAAKDLMNGLKLSEDEYGLVFAFDDEMKPGKVGYPLLQVKGITVVSVENADSIDPADRDANGRRDYRELTQKDGLNPGWFWAKEIWGNQELDATKSIFTALEQAYIEETVSMLKDPDYVPEPALAKLKKFMQKDKGSEISKGGEIPLAAAGWAIRWFETGWERLFGQKPSLAVSVAGAGILESAFIMYVIPLAVGLIGNISGLYIDDFTQGLQIVVFMVMHLKSPLSYWKKTASGWELGKITQDRKARGKVSGKWLYGVLFITFIGMELHVILPQVFTPFKIAALNNFIPLIVHALYNSGIAKLLSFIRIRLPLGMSSKTENSIEPDANTEGPGQRKLFRPVQMMKLIHAAGNDEAALLSVAGSIEKSIPTERTRQNRMISNRYVQDVARELIGNMQNSLKENDIRTYNACAFVLGRISGENIFVVQNNSTKRYMINMPLHVKKLNGDGTVMRQEVFDPKDQAQRIRAQIHAQNHLVGWIGKAAGDDKKADKVEIDVEEQQAGEQDLLELDTEGENAARPEQITPAAGDLNQSADGGQSIKESTLQDYVEKALKKDMEWSNRLTKTEKYALRKEAAEFYAPVAERAELDDIYRLRLISERENATQDDKDSYTAARAAFLNAHPDYTDKLTLQLGLDFIENNMRFWSNLSSGDITYELLQKIAGIIAAKMLRQKEELNVAFAYDAGLLEQLITAAVVRGVGLAGLELVSLASIPELATIAAHAAWNITHGPGGWLTKGNIEEDSQRVQENKTPRINWDAGKVIAEIKQLAAKKVTLQSSFIQAKHSALYGAALRYFGSWEAAVEAAGFDYDAIVHGSSIMIGENVTAWGRFEPVLPRRAKENMIIGRVNKDGKIESNSTRFPANVGSFAIGKEYAGEWAAGILRNDEDHGIVLEFFKYDPEKTGKAAFGKIMLNGYFVYNGKISGLNLGGGKKRTWKYLKDFKDTKLVERMSLEDFIIRLQKEKVIDLESYPRKYGEYAVYYLIRDLREQMQDNIKLIGSPHPRTLPALVNSILGQELYKSNRMSVEDFFNFQAFLYKRFHDKPVKKNATLTSLIYNFSVHHNISYSSALEMRFNDERLQLIVDQYRSRYAEGKALIIVGASGSGKTTIIKKILDKTEDYSYPKLITTRNHRPGEQLNGDSNRTFITQNEFKTLDDENKLIFVRDKEDGRRYGYYIEELDGIYKSGKTAVFDTSSMSTLNMLKSWFPNAEIVYITRFRADATENEIKDKTASILETRDKAIGAADKEARISDAVKNFHQFKDYSFDHIMYNDGPEQDLENHVNEYLKKIQNIWLARNLGTYAAVPGKLVKPVLPLSLLKDGNPGTANNKKKLPSDEKPPFTALSVGFEQFLRLSGLSGIQELSNISAKLINQLIGVNEEFIVPDTELIVERQKLSAIFGGQLSAVSESSAAYGKDFKIKVISNPAALKTYKEEEHIKVCGIPAMMTNDPKIGEIALIIHQGFLEALTAESDRLGAIFDSIHGPGGEKITLLELFTQEELDEYEYFSEIPNPTVEDYLNYHKPENYQHNSVLLKLAEETASSHSYDYIKEIVLGAREFRKIESSDRIRAGHIRKVIKFYEAFINKDFTYFINGLPKNGDLAEKMIQEYTQRLERFWGQFNVISEDEKIAMFWEIALHDIGYAVNSDATDHENNGAVLARKILAKNGVNKYISDLAIKIIKNHTYIGYVRLGEMRANKYFSLIGSAKLLFFQIHNMMDLAGLVNDKDQNTNMLSSEQFKSIEIFGSEDNLTYLKNNYARHRLIMLTKPNMSSPYPAEDEIDKMEVMTRKVFGGEYEELSDVLNNKIDIMGGQTFITNYLVKTDPSYKYSAKYIKLIAQLACIVGGNEVETYCDIETLFPLYRKMGSDRDTALEDVAVKLRKILDSIPDDMTIEQLHSKINYSKKAKIIDLLGIPVTIHEGHKIYLNIAGLITHGSRGKGVANFSKKLIAPIEWIKNILNIRQIKGSSVIHIISSKELEKNIAKFKNSPELTHMFYTDTSFVMPGDLSNIGFNASINGRKVDVWAGMRGGAPVFYMDLRKAGIESAEYEQALSLSAAQVTNYISGTDNVDGNSRGINRIIDICKLSNMAGSSNLASKPVMIVDHTNNSDRVKKDFSFFGINKAPVVSLNLLEMNPSLGVNAEIRKMISTRNAESATMAENKILKMDINDISDFTKALNIFNAVGNGQMMVNWTIFAQARAAGKINDGKIKKLLANAKKYGVIVHTEYKADVAGKAADEVKKLYSLGFQGVSLDLTSLDAQNAKQILDALKGYKLTSVSAPEGMDTGAKLVRISLKNTGNLRFNPGEVIDLEIPDGLTVDQLRDNMRDIPLSNTIIFHSADAAALIGGTRDIMDRKIYASILNILLNFGKTQITNTETARRLGYNTNITELELKSAEEGKKQLSALSEGNLEGGGIMPDSAIYEQASELTSQELKKAYLGAIAEKMLIREKLMSKNKELGLDYEKGKFRFATAGQEEMLGRALLKTANMTSEQLKADREASMVVKESYNEDDTKLIAAVNASPEAEQLNSGCASAIIDIILTGIFSDYNIRRSINRKIGTLDTRTITAVLGAA